MDNMVTENLVKLVDDILKHTDQHKILSCMIATDFSKAFDHVDHDIAIFKSLDMGARPALLPWICDFHGYNTMC